MSKPQPSGVSALKQTIVVTVVTHQIWLIYDIRNIRLFDVERIKNLLISLVLLVQRSSNTMPSIGSPAQSSSGTWGDLRSAPPAGAIQNPRQLSDCEML